MRERGRSLSRSGVAGAVLLGTLIFGLGGWAWGALLAAFFVSSSALSHFKAARKKRVAEKFSKGGQRDLAQALANGGAAALAVIGQAVWPHPVWWAAFVGALATVNADTWATELGVLNLAQPRLITSGRPVEAGTSGGITAAGTLAALAGGALISLAAAGFDLAAGQPPARAFLIAGVGAVAGLLGALADSVLGATVQAIYICNCAAARPSAIRSTPTAGAPTSTAAGGGWTMTGSTSSAPSAAPAWPRSPGRCWPDTVRPNCLMRLVLPAALAHELP